MKLKDLYNPDNERGIFYYIDYNKPLSLAQAIDLNTLDLLFIAKHGQRDVSPMVTTVVTGESPTPEQMEILGSLLGMYADKWNNLFNIYLEEIDLDTYKLKTIEEENVDNTENQNVKTSSNMTDTDKVSGYDSDTLVTDRQSVKDDADTSNLDRTGANERHLERTVTGNTGNRLDDRAKALDLLNTTYLDTVMNDVANELGTLFYI